MTNYKTSITCLIITTTTTTTRVNIYLAYTTLMLIWIEDISYEF